jgi:glycosyltransferase involved in cell wall biosynthesis
VPPRRIVFLTNRLSPAGAETFLLARLRLLDRTRWEPIVAALREGGELAPAFAAGGARVVTLGAARRLDPAALPRLYHLLRDERVDVLEAHVWYACVVARLVGRLAGVPVVITNEQDVRAGANTVRRDLLWIDDATTWMSSACVHITRASERSFAEGTPRLFRGRARRVVIPNGIDVGRVAAGAAAADRAAVRRELGAGEGDLVIGNVARLQPAKGHEHLLDAFARVRAARPDARLVVVGWGTSEAALRARAARLGVADRVAFLGKRHDVHRLLAAFDVFAFPSIHEGQGIALLEAMAAGVPIVASAADGIPEMVRDGETGLLVPPADAAALAAGILRLAGDAALAARVRDRARAVVAAEYSVEAAAARYEALYASLL